MRARASIGSSVGSPLPLRNGRTHHSRRGSTDIRGRRGNSATVAGWAWGLSSSRWADSWGISFVDGGSWLPSPLRTAPEAKSYSQSFNRGSSAPHARQWPKKGARFSLMLALSASFRAERGHRAGPLPLVHVADDLRGSERFDVEVDGVRCVPDDEKGNELGQGGRVHGLEHRAATRTPEAPNTTAHLGALGSPSGAALADVSITDQRR
jgi:hypothetical protein